MNIDEKTLENLFMECVKYWEEQNSKVAYMNAIQYIHNLDIDPYLKTDFIDKKLKKATRK